MADYDYPEAVAGPFEAPPVEFEDREGRPIEIRVYDAERDFEALCEMYDTFDPADRAQGIPPAREERVRSWLDVILDEGQDVIAADPDAERVVGHATLVPDGNEAVELAIFVHQDYQGAGIGSRLIRALLGYGAEQGIEKVWLTVERWNHPAVNLYESVGFESSSVESFELEMALRLN
ncbi:mycothiol acetyltransferase [Halalkalicoccus paucihalophilus]|jgi:diamine N-acetyltransferase|uniref:Mycothiol acetyltransferase n=1 Tax=Halalkalicoccus paucihalophilus TaxID=1008153 RepID=A0A151AJM3_9EURY|nr:GNAT family N-acetyltransferase [Halalkalicoccus paucihalophilus]KYH27868.1 mycothiol acetyltransferase [Halalkalicoccus paucihalophilus]